jgi:hypothetical protein
MRYRAFQKDYLLEQRDGLARDGEPTVSLALTAR